MSRAFKSTLFLGLLMSQTSALADEASKVDDSHSNKIIEQVSIPNEEGQAQYLLDLGWDSKYIAEGRSELNKGGIYWATASVQKDNFNVYALVGRGDTENFTEWNIGVEYGFNLTENIEASVGYQRLEFYGDERAHDNELFGLLQYTKVEWLTPSVSYTYATEAGGYFVEVSLHSNWELMDGFSVIPYITQGFDFQFATEEHDGPNHFQFGVETEYALGNNMALSAHISHRIAQEDIKLEAENDDDLDGTFAGIHFSWDF